MRAAGLRGIPREKTRKTTIGDGAETERPADLVKRQFVADRAEPAVGGRPDLRPHPRRLGLRRVRPRRVLPDGRGLAGVHQPAHRPGPGRPRHGPVGPAAGRPGRHRPGPSLRPRSPISSDPLHRAARRGRGRRLRRQSKGDTYDNAMAEAFNSLFKAECIRNPVMRPNGGWKSVDDVEIAVAEYVDWFNHRRLHGEIGLVPPAEFEANHWASTTPEHYPETPVPAGAGSK